MAKSYYVGSYRRRGGGRRKLIFFLVVLVQLAAVGIYLYLTREKKPEGAATPEVPAPAAPAPAAPAPASPLPAAPGTASPSSSPAPAPAAPSAELRAGLADARAAIDAGQLLQARQTLEKLLAAYPDNAEVIDLLGQVNMKLLKSPLMMPEKEYYVIQPGDSLFKIARKFHTTVALLKEMNGLKSDVIRLGDRLLVFKGNFTIHVSKSRNTLDLLLNGKLFKRYPVGTGKFGKTPAVRFKIVDKIKEPAWTRPSDNKRIEYGDPENVLGSRWMALKCKEHPELTGFGIHGTWDRDSIGKQSSAGCIRMLNEDVEELFDLVPRGTVVTITE